MTRKELWVSVLHRGDLILVSVRTLPISVFIRLSHASKMLLFWSVILLLVWLSLRVSHTPPSSGGSGSDCTSVVQPDSEVIPPLSQDGYRHE